MPPTSNLKVCVFGSSSSKTPPSFLEAASTLGQALAAGNHICVNGAGKTGCMGALNDGCVDAGGKIIGVIHRMWVSGGADELHRGIKSSELVIVEGTNLAERKSRLLE